MTVFQPASLSDPRTDVIVHADVVAEHVTTPAVVIARHPQYRDAGVHEIRERGEDSKRRPRDDGAPLEPELEEIAVDDERARTAAADGAGMLGASARRSPGAAPRCVSENT